MVYPDIFCFHSSDYDTRIALYGTPVWFVILEVLWRMRKKHSKYKNREVY
ncbi:hypothetical protein XCR1_790035 [Xenorhabdus cabanillasii JM26]|uniref:Uncharacterized protein n=1 Tax=Xenorhabdus cabanillasii JM26 TaxID=1427517 RepID=W1JA64_9GAMM|nr:hypothetical protein XCR1_790035 [Xenorhabdus cabanillasii JM26]